MPNGIIRLARPNSNFDFSTHLGLSGGFDVKYAGSIRFTNSTSSMRGTIRYWQNDSGHYQPTVADAAYAGLPLVLFKAH